jgi:rhamnosyltransferase subunit B
VPHLGDQFDNGARIARLGVGVTMARASYRAEAAASVLGGLLEDGALIAAAAHLGAIAAGEDGAAEAAARIAALLAVRGSFE